MNNDEFVKLVARETAAYYSEFVLGGESKFKTSGKVAVEMVCRERNGERKGRKEYSLVVNGGPIVVSTSGWEEVKTLYLTKIVWNIWRCESLEELDLYLESIGF